MSVVSEICLRLLHRYVTTGAYRVIFRLFFTWDHFGDIVLPNIYKPDRVILESVKMELVVGWFGVQPQ